MSWPLAVVTTTLNFTYLSIAQRAEHWHNVRLGQLLQVLFQVCFGDLMEAISKSIKTRSKWWSAGCPVGDPQKNWNAPFKQGFCFKAGTCSLCYLRSIKQGSGNRGRARPGAGRGSQSGFGYAGKESRVSVTCQSECRC